MHMKLLDLENLARGNPRQKAAYQALTDLNIFSILTAYSPVIAGTIPLDVDVVGSDLDIICAAPNLVEFAEVVISAFGKFPEFKAEHCVQHGKPTFFARFQAFDFPIEIFAQPGSVFTQRAVLHMLIEARLLAFAPPAARDEIRALKRGGVKTEPAFAQVFELEGDPYEKLLEVARLPDHEILKIAHAVRWRSVQ